MIIDLLHKSNRVTWIKFSIYLPHFIYAKPVKSPFSSYNNTEIDFDTKIIIRTSKTYFYFLFRLFGFGVEGTIQDGV